MELRDDEIALRRWRLDDADELAAAVHDPEIGRWMPAIPYPYSKLDADTFLDGAVGRIGAFAIVAADRGRLLGGISINARKWRRAEIGYWVRADVRGRGIASRALVLISEWGFGQGYRRLQLHADIENERSQRVAEKAGFTREGVLRAWIEQDGVPRDHVLYSLVVSDRAPTVSATHD